MMKALTGARVFDGARILDRTAVLIDAGRIAAVVDPADVPAAAERQDLGGGLLAPGFIDVQVNGGGGVLFNDAPTVESIRTIATAHRRFGTTALLPTLITDTDDAIDRAIAAAAAAIEAGVPGVLGIHIEGPFLNPDRKGVHDPRHMRPMAAADIRRVSALGARGVTLLTLAPERQAPGTIRTLSAAGLRIAAGHTAATGAEITAALDEGLSGYTHLFNAMTPMNSREPGVVGTALDDRRGFFGLIVDGIHVHPASMRVAVRAGGTDRAVLVTDAMPPVGAPGDPAFMLNGRRITVADGRCVTDDGTLAGAALDMASAVRNAHRMLGIGLEDALRMASLNPARWLGLDRRFGRIAPGYAASLVHLDDTLDVAGTWITGEAGL